jgi:hypothetical protein
VDLPGTAEIAVSVYSADGRRIGELAHGRFAAGSHRIDWTLPGGAGMYLVRLTARPDSGPAWSAARWMVR